MKKIRINIFLLIGLCFSSSIKTTPAKIKNNKEINKITHKSNTKKINRPRLNISNKAIKNRLADEINDLELQIQTLEKKSYRTTEENNKLSILHKMKKILNQRYPELNKNS